MTDPFDRYNDWEECRELIEHTYNEMVDYARKADKDKPSYLIVLKSLEKILDFMDFHSKELDCELDAYEEAQQQREAM